MKPSQVLITQAFYDRIAHSQPALRSSPRAGIYEYLWTNEQRLNQLQAEAEFMPTLVSGVIQPPALVDTVVHQPVKTAVEPPPAPARREPPRPPAPQPQPGLSLPLRIANVPSGCLGCGFLPSAALSRS